MAIKKIENLSSAHVNNNITQYANEATFYL